MKYEEITKKSDSEIAELLKENRQDLYKLKVKALTEPLANPQQKSQIRKTIARLATEQSARQSKEQA